MSSPPPYIIYRVIHAESSGDITEESIHAGYSICYGLDNNPIIHLYRFNHHMNRDNRGMRTCYISTINYLFWALLTTLQYQQQGKRDIGLVMIDIDKALECGDIIFHVKNLERFFGHINYSK